MYELEGLGMGSKKDGDRNPQITISLSAQTHADYVRVADHKGLPVATYIRTVLEKHHESLDFASILRRANKTGDWKTMKITELVESVPPAKRDEALAYLRHLAGLEDEE